MSYFNHIDRFGDNIALQTVEGSITYTSLVNAADRIAKKIPKRSLVMVLCKSNPAAITGYVGFLRNDVIPIMVNHEIDPDLLRSLYNAYRPNAVYAPSGLWNEGEKCCDYGGYTLFKTQYNSIYPMPDNLGLLLTTSGSTGSPKLVRQTYENIKANTESIVEYLKIDDSERAITTLPINYTYGLSIVQTHLSVGASIFCTEKTFFDRDIWAIFRDYGITSFGAVPYTFEMLKRLRFLEMNLPHLRYVTQAGGKLSRELQLEYAQALRAQGKKFIVMYGATEATARMAFLPAEVAVEKAGSMGIPIPGGRFEIIDVNGEVITEPDKPGELVYYGKNVTMGYAQRVEDLKEPDSWHGRLVTGDIAKRDADGYYYIVGRKSRFLKMFGNRVNLMEVEKLLLDAGWEAACVGEDNLMEVYCTSEDISDIQNYLSMKLKLNAQAIRVYHIQEIPRSESGKVLYSKLKSRN